MGKAFSIVTRPLRDFNIESRAHKAISRDKRPQAPKYKKDEIETERLMKEHADAFEESLKKNTELDKRLKSIFVTSYDPQPEERFPPASNLPKDRSTPEYFEFGVKEPDIMPPGKVSLKTAIEFITNHQMDAVNYPVRRIAKDHDIPEEKIASILKYCRVFEMYLPQERPTKANFFGPFVPRVKVKTIKKLPSGDGEKMKSSE